MSATASAGALVIRANRVHIDAVLKLASKFVARSPFAQFVVNDERTTREFVSRVFDIGVVFVLEVDGQTVGAIMGMMLPLWFSTDQVAQELGWWVEEAHRGHGNSLRRRFEEWAAQRKATVVCMSDVVLDDATPAGTLYERAGYEMVERAWMKRLP